MAVKHQKKEKLDKPAVERKGLVMCNIGLGKGKTTAAMGTAIRASGAGMNVFVLQFVKAKKREGTPKQEEGEWPLSCEIEFFNNISIPKKLGKIDNEQVGIGFVGILGDVKEKQQHVKEALHGLERARQVITSGEYEVVVLDEILSALELDLIKESDILDLIAIKGEFQHLIITGHEAFPDIINACDLVTDMRMIKHPYYGGILAQRGIDF